jgi:hypothetical protein
MYLTSLLLIITAPYFVNIMGGIGDKSRGSAKREVFNKAFYLVKHIFPGGLFLGWKFEEFFHLGNFFGVIGLPVGKKGK